jgi:hypothetical protein
MEVAATGPGARFVLPPTAEAGEYLHHLSGGALRRLPSLVAAVTAEITEQMPVYASGSFVSQDELSESVAANLRNMIGALNQAAGMDLSRARATGVRRARQGVPLPDVLRAFRIGFAALWHTLLDLAANTGETELRTLVTAASWRPCCRARASPTTRSGT